MADRDRATEELERAVTDAIDSVARLENLLKDIGSQNLRNLIELIPQTEHDMRMTRLRLQALLPSKPTRSNTEDTPTEPIIRRKSSQFTIKKPE